MLCHYTFALTVTDPPLDWSLRVRVPRPYPPSSELSPPHTSHLFSLFLDMDACLTCHALFNVGPKRLALFRPLLGPLRSSVYFHRIPGYSRYAGISASYDPLPRRSCNPASSVVPGASHLARLDHVFFDFDSEKHADTTRGSRRQGKTSVDHPSPAHPPAFTLATVPFS